MKLLSGCDIPAIKKLEDKLSPLYQSLQQQASFYENASQKIIQLVRNFFIFDKEDERLKTLNAKSIDSDWLFNYEDYRQDLNEVLSSELDSFDSLDEVIAKTSLPISLDKGKYQFDEKSIKTKPGREFFKKLTFMLNCMRLSLALKSLYPNALNESFLDLTHYDNALNASQSAPSIEELWEYDESNLIQAYTDYSDWNQWASNEILSIENGKDEFEKGSINNVGYITELLGRLADELTEAYKAFPNYSMTRYVKDSEWLSFLKNIANELFTYSSYTWSTYNDTFTVTNEKLKTIQSQWMEFHTTTLNTIPDLRAAFLKQSNQKFNSLVDEIKHISARTKIDLTKYKEKQKEKQNLNNSIYSGYSGGFYSTTYLKQEELPPPDNDYSYQ